MEKKKNSLELAEDPGEENDPDLHQNITTCSRFLFPAKLFEKAGENYEH